MTQPHALGAWQPPRPSKRREGVRQRWILTYVTPAASHVSLPAGATSFLLTLSYGSTTQPASFSAVVNGLDVTGLFHPAPGAMETVRLDLKSGSNVVKLSIDGMVGTRFATDSDRLVLDVP